MFYRDFPADAQENWDILAKALMIRAGGNVVVTIEELRAASETQAELELSDGALTFRVERN